MKGLVTLPVLLLFVVFPNRSFAAEQSFRGEIADSSCATNVHSLTRSHNEMLKGKSMGTDAKSCANYCVHKLGAEYMLKTTNDVYHLDNQTSVEPFAGTKVLLKGSLDVKTHTIHLTSIHQE
jgi:hypothetical protein